MTSSNRNVSWFLIGLATGLVLFLFITSPALADHRHDINITLEYPDPAPAPGVNTTTEIYTGMGNTQFEKGMAMSAAGDACVFDYAAGWQSCVGGGWYGSQSAVNGSIVTRVDQFMLRFNFQTDTDFDEQAFAVGGSWHW